MQVLLGHEDVLRESKNNAYANFWGLKEVCYGICASSECTVTLSNAITTCIDNSHNLLPVFCVKLWPCAPNGVDTQNGGDAISEVVDSKILSGVHAPSHQSPQEEGPKSPFSFSPELLTLENLTFPKKT